MSTRRLPPVHLPARLYPQRLEAGCDEVGRGCIAGPVVAAAVILPPDFDVEGVTDSKQLTSHARLELAEVIRRKALSYAIAFVTAAEIDEINILQASFLAMTRAVEQLDVVPEHLLVDGNRFRSTLTIPYTCIVRGDASVASIAAASILAKTARDAFMHDLHKNYPVYGWDRNVGYPTPAHLQALRKYGCSPYHRRSFGPCQPSLF